MHVFALVVLASCQKGVTFARGGGRESQGGGGESGGKCARDGQGVSQLSKAFGKSFPKEKIIL